MDALLICLIVKGFFGIIEYGCWVWVIYKLRGEEIRHG